MPLDALLSDEYAASRRAQIGDVASPDWRPGAVAGREPFRPPLRQADADASDGLGEPTIDRSGGTRGDTCHIDVVDRWGNMIAVTPSGGWLQSSPTIPELGFCLGTRLQITWLDAGSPAALRPGSRPRTTLSPTLVLREGHAVAALGTPGGDQQEQWQVPVLLRMLAGGYSAQQAIDAPSLHTTALVDSFWPRGWTPSGAVVEDRLGDEVIAGSSGVGTTSRGPATGPSAACPRSAGMPRPGRSGRRPMRAGCRATRRVADRAAISCVRAEEVGDQWCEARRRPRRRGACDPSPRKSVRRRRSMRSSHPDTQQPRPPAA